jgi:hypothetical protein
VSRYGYRPLRFCTVCVYCDVLTFFNVRALVDALTGSVFNECQSRSCRSARKASNESLRRRSGSIM